MKLYTTTVYSWRRIKKLNITFLDTTVKTGNRLYSPTWPLLTKYQNGLISDTDYTDAYYPLMRASYKNNQSEWDALLENDTLALACYCKPDTFCHRLLLKDMILKIAESKGMAVQYLGEI
jgi:uncharacterized protein YeaO (DUF488 family)